MQYTRIIFVYYYINNTKYALYDNNLFCLTFTTATPTGAIL